MKKLIPMLMISALSTAPVALAGEILPSAHSQPTSKSVVKKQKKTKKKKAKKAEEGQGQNADASKSTEANKPADTNAAPVQPSGQNAGQPNTQ